MWERLRLRVGSGLATAGPRLPYADRHEAGRELAVRLDHYRGWPDLVVLALPRGGVPVAVEVAAALDAPLDVFVVRKLGVPGHEELALGAVASGGHRSLNRSVVRGFGITDEQVEAITASALEDVRARDLAYRRGRSALSPTGRTVILVDDGLATGASARAAVASLRAARPKRVVLAVPAAPVEACVALGQAADEVVCPATPEPFGAVGMWYRDFAPVSTEQLRDLLDRSEEAYRYNRI
jgi:putative phosphoribosyl transferase